MQQGNRFHSIEAILGLVAAGDTAGGAQCHSNTASGAQCHGDAANGTGRCEDTPENCAQTASFPGHLQHKSPQPSATGESNMSH
ncbi:hypothetical protein ElyMa_002050300 [Elysia marginata]|uniref:Uncharacterized protein n=1 Tax=Elysia marginata TaxID=1093978 RepID=A0AAV4F7U5_9GAST|nr:hypothetical protein ElyMa_002050300 [Elysia marginata]